MAENSKDDPMDNQKTVSPKDLKTYVVTDDPATWFIHPLWEKETFRGLMVKKVPKTPGFDQLLQDQMLNDAIDHVWGQMTKFNILPNGHKKDSNDPDTVGFIEFRDIKVHKAIVLHYLKTPLKIGNHVVQVQPNLREEFGVYSYKTRPQTTKNRPRRADRSRSPVQSNNQRPASEPTTISEAMVLWFEANVEQPVQAAVREAVQCMFCNQTVPWHAYPEHRPTCSRYPLI